MSSITVKQATEADIPVLENILLDTVNWLNEIGQPLWTEDQIKWERLSKDLSASDFYIAYLNEIPAGCMAVVDNDPQFWADIPKGESLFIHKLAVKRFAAGQGVSDALIFRAKEMCVDKEILFLRLDCDSHRPKQCAVYERNGFVFTNEKIIFGKYHVAFYECKMPEFKIENHKKST